MEQGCKIIAIGGGSGSGKSVISNAILHKLGGECCSIISQDSYYFGPAENYDHPQAIEFSLLAEHLDKLKKGKGVEIPCYDFSTHKRMKGGRNIAASKVVLVDGTMVLKQLDNCHAKVFVSVPEKVRLERRMARDIEERGRTKKGVLEQWNSQVVPMHEEFVEVSKEGADLVLSGEDDIEENAQLIISTFEL
jgi:uridine kinase